MISVTLPSSPQPPPVLNLVLVPLVSEFNYTFKIVADEKYGKKNQETGEWNGMMGELLAQVTKICMQIQGRRIHLPRIT